MKKGIFAAVAVAVAMTFSAGTASAGDAEAGKKVFKKCKSCHNTNDKDKVGPGLAGVFGAVAGAKDSKKYSSELKESGITWDEANLDKFLTKPKDMFKKTKMSFAGLKKEDDRKNVIAYLKTLK